MNILYIPYRKTVEALLIIKGINLDYPEDATNQQKYKLIEAWENLSQVGIEDIEKTFAESIKSDCDKFVRSLKSPLLRKIEKIRILPLFDNEMVFTSVIDAIAAIEKYDIIPEERATFCKFEICIKFTNGDKIEGSFHEREETLKFLRIYK